MTTDTRPLDAALHRRLADELSAYVWSLIERTDRTPDVDNEMVHAAHAARWHGARAEGRDAGRLVIAEWQLSHAYALVGRAEPALHHAHECLRMCRSQELGDYLLAYACEALARAAALAGDGVECEKWLAEGWVAAARISDPATRQRFEADLSSIRSA